MPVVLLSVDCFGWSNERNGQAEGNDKRLTICYTHTHAERTMIIHFILNGAIPFQFEGLKSHASKFQRDREAIK